MAKVKNNNGAFKRGFDSRRHKFTTEECQRGFWSAIISIVSRNPDAVDSSGRHMALDFLKVAGRINKEKNR